MLKAEGANDPNQSPISLGGAVPQHVSPLPQPLRIQAVAIPRFEPGAQGIHLIWTWPDVLPLSEQGYDIQRRDFFEKRSPERCETIDRHIMDILKARAEYPALLGQLRMLRGASFKPIMDATLLPSGGKAASEHPQGFGDPNIEEVHANVAAALRASPVTQNAVAAEHDVFIQELSMPTDLAIVTAQARTAISVGISGGKVVAVAPGTTIPITMQLSAPSMDTIVIYVLSPLSLQICVFDPPEIEDAEWLTAPYIVKDLTLPIHEADPSLAVGSAEYFAAKARLVGGEALTEGDFQQMIPAMRLAVAAKGLGRSGERTMLVRSAADQPYEELAFETQLTALTLHPKARRVLGFGFADRRGLTPGHAYTYRITVRFRAEDLYDDIYDVHLAPTATPLPTAFTIRDLGVRFQTPVKIVLDREPPSSALYAVSRRGIRIDTTAIDASWSTPDFGLWSAIFDFPRSVTDVVLEVAPGHSFTYAGGNMWAFGVAPAPLCTSRRRSRNCDSQGQERCSPFGYLPARPASWRCIPRPSRSCTPCSRYLRRRSFSPHTICRHLPVFSPDQSTSRRRFLRVLRLASS